MTVFEKIKEDMTIETLAEMGVRLVSVNNQQLYYLTSSGQMFAYSRYNEALNHEFQWLSQEMPQPQDTQTNEE